MEEPLRFDQRTVAPPLTWTSRRRLPRISKRVAVAALVVLWLGCVVGLAYRAWHGHIPWSLLFWVPFTVILMRHAERATEVTSGEVVVRGVWRETRVPAGEIAEVEDPGRWGVEVRLLRREGEPLVLPYVQPSDVSAIRARLGSG